MSFMDALEKWTAEQERERERLRAHQITVQVHDKKNSKRDVHQKDMVIE